MDMREVNRKTVAAFRAGGEIDGLNRDQLLLLTTVGRVSGQRRTTPMMFHADGDRLLVMASNRGAPRDPDWYLNLVANPKVTVEVGAETYDALAIPIEGDDRERAWPTITAAYPEFADHEAATDRVIPVVALSRDLP